MTLSLETVLEEIGESDCCEAVAPHWEDSLASLPGGSLDFLEAENISRYRADAGIEADVDVELIATASRIAGSPALRALAWHAVRACYSYGDIAWWSIGRWPSFERSLGSSAALFYLLVALEAVPLIRAKHRELGVPESVTRQTIRGPGAFLQRYRDGNDGRPGIFRREVGWLRHNTSGELFRIGRFEYMHRMFHEPYYAYRDPETGATLLLAAEGTRFTADGWADERPGSGDPGWWEAHRVVDGHQVRGYPISPYGRAEHREVAVDLRRWKEVVVPNETPILDVHIPVGGRMTLESIRASLSEASTFFQHYFPQKRFAGFRCSSWILGPQLEEIFPAGANLVRFLREIYLYPVPSSRYDGFFFIFADDTLNEQTVDAERLAGLPERTSLQARVKEWVRAGKPWRGGGMLFLEEDLGRFGSACYRSSWPPEPLTR